MPNWVQNYVEIGAEGPKLEEIMQAIRRDDDEYGSFDFNKVLPMPKSLDLTCGSITNDSVDAYISSLMAKNPNAATEHLDDLTAAAVINGRYRKVNPEMSENDIKGMSDRYNMSVEAMLALGKQYVDNQKEHGAPDWYRWRVKNWGTKWDLEEGSVLGEDGKLSFQTAWETPKGVIRALSEKFPAVMFALKFADEDLGQNVGSITFLSGQVHDSNIPEPGSSRAYEMAAEIWEYDLAEMGYRLDPEDGTYVYDETLLEEYNRPLPSLNEQIQSAEARVQGATTTNPKEHEPGRS